MAGKVRDGWVSGVLSASFLFPGGKGRFKTCARTTAYQRELSVSFHFSLPLPLIPFEKDQTRPT